MGKSVALYMILILAAGVFVGWHFRRAQAAHGDLKTYKSRIPVFRQVRLRSGLTSLAVALLTLLALKDLIH